MIGAKPKFIDSPYFVGEPYNWHLKPGAPKEVVDEFEAYMNLDSILGETKDMWHDEIEEV